MQAFMYPIELLRLEARPPSNTNFHHSWGPEYLGPPTRYRTKIATHTSFESLQQILVVRVIGNYDFKDASRLVVARAARHAFPDSRQSAFL